MSDSELQRPPASYGAGRALLAYRPQADAVGALTSGVCVVHCTLP